MWALLYHFKLVIFIHFKINCIHFSSAKQKIKAWLFSLLLLNCSPTAQRACSCLLSNVKWVIFDRFFFLHKMAVETTLVPLPSHYHEL